MKRCLFAIFAAAVLSAPASAADCGKDYKEFWSNIDREAFSRLTPEQMVDLNRTTLRVYDSCASGDERFTAGNLFKQLDASKYAKASDIFSSGAFAPPGAKTSLSSRPRILRGLQRQSSGRRRTPRSRP
jgi:hypothetical protein